ncbi:MAG: hypothetical protein Q4C52_05075 [Eubacteriales bacterium]|nr:hypothetical protein [Eubacteriales bacterium]
MKKLLIVSHCILNTASKVAMDEKDLEQEYKMKNRLMQRVIEKDIQLIQLPCPEFRIYGSRRWGHVKTQFIHPHFRNECKRMLEPVLLQLEEYLAYPDEFIVLGVVSVEGSPSCGYHLTCVGEWGGELAGDAAKLSETIASCRSAGEPGILMQILEEEFRDRSFDVPIVTVEEAIRMIDS